MNIKNYTAHPLLFYREEDVNYASNVRKYFVKNGAEPYLEVPSLGMLSVAFENQKIVDDEIPVYQRTVLRLDALPERESENDMVVVSAVYATVYSNYRMTAGMLPYPLYSVKDVVYDRNGAPAGCLGLLMVS